MARGDFTLFEEFSVQLGDKEHDLDADTLKLMIITNTTPLATQATPAYSTWSAQEVTETVGGYSAGGVDVVGDYQELNGTETLQATDIALTQNAGGFDDAYWGILYNDTNGSKLALGFLEFTGPVSQKDGPVNINWNASGILTVAV